MKIKKSLLFILVGVLLCFVVAGCATKPDEKGSKDITDLYTVTKNEDNTHSYSFADLNGTVLFEKENVVREPKINMVSVNVYELITQTGTGLSTNWAVYCDVENSKVSETFRYVLMTQDEYVIHADYENGKHSVIVQNIFDKSKYYKEHILTNCSPVGGNFIGDIVTGAKPNGDGIAVVTYHTGNDYKETELIIEFP